MDRSGRFKHYLYATLLCTGLAACGGSSLLWETTYDSDNADIAVDAALDQSGNLYVVGTSRSNPGEENFDYQGLILKYSAAGELAWQRILPEIGHVRDVIPLNGNRIVVETTNAGFYSLAYHGSYYLASAETGQLIKQLSDEDDTNWSQALPRGNRVALLNQYNPAAGGGHDIQIYDEEGNLTSAINLAGTPYALKANYNGGFYLLSRNEWQSGVRLYELDRDLNLTWASEELPLNGSMCGYYNDGSATHIALDNNSDIVIQCPIHLVKLSSQGDILFQTQYADMFRDQLDESPALLDYELNPAMISIDDNNDIYVASTRANLFTGQVGNLIQRDYFTFLKSDTLVMKFDGSTGERVWDDVINGFISGTAQGASGDFYYPMAMSVENNRLQVTVRGFRGNYIGDYQAEGDALTYCTVLLDSLEALNTCQLESTANAYAKTIYYQLGDGTRSNGKSYTDDYPTAALLGEDRSIYMVGDSSWEGAKDSIEINAQAKVLLDADGWAQQRDGDTSIYIRKYKL